MQLHPDPAATRVQFSAELWLLQTGHSSALGFCCDPVVQALLAACDRVLPCKGLPLELSGVAPDCKLRRTTNTNSQSRNSSTASCL